LEKLEKLAIRKENCNEKMSLNKANTILLWLFFLLSRRKQVVTSCLGFFAFLWQSQLGKSWRKMSPLSLKKKTPITVMSRGFLPIAMYGTPRLLLAPEMTPGPFVRQ
jgi:hypothetical protein